MRRTFSILALAAIGACGAGPEASPGEPPASGSEPAFQSCSNSTDRFVFYPKTIDALVAESTVVVVGEVVDVETGAAEGPSDERTQPRFLTVAVEETIKGGAEKSLRVKSGSVDVGTTGSNGSVCPWLSTGDRAVFALSPDRGVLTATGAASIFILDGGAVGDTKRSEPLAERIEGLTEDEFVDALRGAK